MITIKIKLFFIMQHGFLFLVCELYKYGPNCTEDCGHCKHSRSCSIDTGVCPDGCEEGWTGEHCDTRRYQTTPYFFETLGKNYF